MSRLEELIAELCPDGVEFTSIQYLVKLKIVTTVTPSIKIKRNDYKESGITPIVSQELEFISGYCDIIDGNIPQNNYVCFGDHSEHLKYIDFPFVQGADGLKIMRTSEDTMLTKYFYYALCNFYQKHNNYERHFKYLLDTKIPVPPLPVQSEIVKILDNFTELTAELTARKKQYSEYLNILIDKDRFSNPAIIKLGELFDFKNGLSKGKEFFGQGTPFIRYTDVYNKRVLHAEDISALVECTPSELEKLKVTRGDVLFTRTSETAEDVGWSSVMLDDIGVCVFNGFTIRAKPKTDRLLPEYCAYCFSTNEFRQYVTSHCAFTTRASLTGSTIAEYSLAVPNITEQQEVVNILDKLYLLCNSLTSGLPAEIAARQRQYEYYRDKLLTFKELTA